MADLWWASFQGKYIGGEAFVFAPTKEEAMALVHAQVDNDPMIAGLVIKDSDVDQVVYDPSNPIVMFDNGDY